MPPDESRLSPDKEKSFRDGLKVPIGKPGWRRAGIALGSNGKIIGHIDLGSYQERLAAHRCLLGMGVQRNHWKFGLGRLLIEIAPTKTKIQIWKNNGI